MVNLVLPTLVYNSAAAVVEVFWWVPNSKQWLSK